MGQQPEAGLAGAGEVNHGLGKGQGASLAPADRTGDPPPGPATRDGAPTHRPVYPELESIERQSELVTQPAPCYHYREPSKTHGEKMKPEEAIKKIKAILSEQPINQYETAGEAQNKLSRVADVVYKTT